VLEDYYKYVPRLRGGGGNAQKGHWGGALRFPENPGGRIRG